MRQVYLSNLTAISSMTASVYGYITLSNICLIVGLLAGLFSIYISYRQKLSMDKNLKQEAEILKDEKALITREKSLERKEKELLHKNIKNKKGNP